ncbi:MAG: hypothetical protein KKF46_07395 [Nanoarchaeota archaeon]|nr:hypothetical protein [Nanoarchaeota archaeon]MBU1322152.1 hypothetical protein [Nanoarchaeota archaeon]MBU1597873.1 hypothetical protein [Nanoarchaeota archaeon]MBU2441292.1 hypothetical protein [Nanoarchaeota archaeon]
MEYEVIKKSLERSLYELEDPKRIKNTPDFAIKQKIQQNCNNIESIVNILGYETINANYIGYKTYSKDNEALIQLEPTGNYIYFSDTSKEELLRVSNEIDNNKKSKKYDDLCNAFMFECMPFIGLPLATILAIYLKIHHGSLLAFSGFVFPHLVFIGSGCYFAMKRDKIYSQLKDDFLKTKNTTKSRKEISDMIASEVFK